MGGWVGMWWVGGRGAQTHGLGGRADVVGANQSGKVGCVGGWGEDSGQGRRRGHESALGLRVPGGRSSGGHGAHEERRGGGRRGVGGRSEFAGRGPGGCGPGRETIRREVFTRRRLRAAGIPSAARIARLSRPARGAWRSRGGQSRGRARSATAPRPRPRRAPPPRVLRKGCARERTWRRPRARPSAPCSTPPPGRRARAGYGRGSAAGGGGWRRWERGAGWAEPLDWWFSVCAGAVCVCRRGRRRRGGARACSTPPFE